MRAEDDYRPLALVLSHQGDERDRDCRLLSEKGYNVLGFADVESTAAWLEEESPEVAIIETGAGPRWQGICELLAGRSVTLIWPDPKLSLAHSSFAGEHCASAVIAAQLSANRICRGSERAKRDPDHVFGLGGCQPKITT